MFPPTEEKSTKLVNLFQAPCGDSRAGVAPTPRTAECKPVLMRCGEGQEWKKITQANNNQKKTNSL